MPKSNDDENDREVTWIDTPNGFQLDSTETIATLVEDAFKLSRKMVVDLDSLHDLLKDLHALLGENPDAKASTEIGDLDMPPGWKLTDDDESDDDE